MKVVPLVTVTPVNAAADYYLAEVTTEGFTLVLEETALKDIEFNWVATQVENPSTTVSDEPTAEELDISEPIVEESEEVIENDPAPASESATVSKTASATAELAAP